MSFLHGYTTSKVATVDQVPAPQDPLLAPLVIINAAQLPLKLEPSTYIAWKASIDALLYGHGLQGFIDGTRPCPPPRLNIDGTSTPNVDYLLWMR